MRILVDTNILFSAMLFRNSKPAKALRHASDFHEMLICDRSIQELRKTVQKKGSRRLPDIEVFLAEHPYELIHAVEHGTKLIRDEKDQPILNAAIVAGADVILTGDKDFLSLGMEYPRCLTAAQFLEEEGVEL